MPKIPEIELTTNSPIVGNSENEWGQKLNTISELTEDKINEILVDLNFLTGTNSVWNVIDYPSYADFPLIGQPITIYFAIAENKRYMWGGNVYVDLNLGAGTVSSINSRIGDVILTKSDVGLSSVDNTSDQTKANTTTYSALTTTSKTITGGINEIKSSVDSKQPLDTDLTAIANLTTNGIIVKTGSGTSNTRSIVVTGEGVSIANGDGILDNPMITSNATSSNTASTIVSRNADGNFNASTITATLNGSASTLTTSRTIGIATGDVTSTGSSFNGSQNNTNEYSIGANKVTNSKMAQMPTMTVKGNDAVGSADPQDLTVPEVRTMIQDSTHRMVTDAQIFQWNSTSSVIKYYGTQTLAIADEANISLGNYIETMGGVSINDGLGGEYVVESTLTDTTGGWLIATGKYANRRIKNVKSYNAELTGESITTTQASGDNSNKIATTAFVNAMLGGNTVPAKDLNQNGYVKMANGLILQWGMTGANIHGGSCTFPITFPNSCFNVVLTGSIDGNWIVTAKNKSSFTYGDAAVAGAHPVNYIAIGY